MQNMSKMESSEEQIADQMILQELSRHGSVEQS
jgi:hypothetical protein